MKETFQKIKDFLLWAILGEHCYYCNAVIDRNEKLCPNCKENLPRISGEKCKYCGSAKDRCGCKKKHTEFDGITAPFYYEDGIAECLKLLKFNSVVFMAKRLAKNMANAVREDFKDVSFDCICYVPFSTLQKITRNYNQSKLLADELSKELNIPVKSVLFKLFDTKTQHETKGNLRKGNTYGIYDVKDYADIKGKTVLLVDDIMTTGETLNTCAVIMKIRGAEKVYCATAAITPRKSKDENKKENENKDKNKEEEA